MRIGAAFAAPAEEIGWPGWPSSSGIVDQRQHRESSKGKFQFLVCGGIQGSKLGDRDQHGKSCGSWFCWMNLTAPNHVVPCCSQPSRWGSLDHNKGATHPPPLLLMLASSSRLLLCQLVAEPHIVSSRRCGLGLDPNRENARKTGRWNVRIDVR